ncbi:MAG: adaptor protein MecA [Ruminococcaceae bacterium]|nr:adaptor protein MecA [Oscillospiraceae bacterium]
MNVLRVAENRIKIFLTDCEVINSFGNYENLYYMSEKGKIIMSALLRDVIFKNYSLNGSESFKTKIKAQKNRGCEITVSLIEKKRGFESENLILIFSEEENLNRLLSFIFGSNNSFIKELELYKINRQYVLIIKHTDDGRVALLNEFCFFKSKDSILLEFIKEHGKSLLCTNGLEKYAKCLIKGF